METFTGISQLLRNLCHGSVWSYAILWKLQETTQMLLAGEDAYASSIKSRVTMEYAPRTGFYSSDPVVTTFGCETNARIEDIPAFSIDVVISNISRYCYFLGEGIVGITASSEKHKWISLWELNSRLLLEYPEEMQLQAAAGIKTILLVPVLPFGVVQLGSFFELSEDFKMVAQIKDLFLSSQYTLEVQSIFSLEADGDIALDRPMIQKYSACLATATESIDPSNFKPVDMQDWTNLNCDETTGEELLPQLMVQPNDQLPQVGLGADSSEEIIWDEMYNELLSNFSIERAMINSSINTGSALVGDQSILSYRDEETEMIPVIGNWLAPDDLNHIEESYLAFGEESDGIFLNYPGEEIQLSSPAEFQSQSEVNELTNPSSFLQVQVPKPVEEPAAIMKDNRADNLPDDKHFESSGYRTSSITQCKDGDLLCSEVSIPGIMPSAFSNTEGFTSHLMNVQNSSTNIPSSNDDQQDTIEQELHKKSSKQGKKRGCGGSRPRDRQLIQDRIRELRELIPNGSKCSIDELLERAVAHMMFLQSVPVHAEKLNKSKRNKVGTYSNIYEKSLPQNESSLVGELITKRNNLPVIVENLEQPDQMLIEMQCRDYGLFLDTMQAFKRLKLTIVEGTLQSMLTEQWAHFIVQVPIGFNRIDILWPLMQLLQFKF
ncbi:transcription factor EMB1444 isoform X2 [Dendrobium catenatum]|uniref:Transcription factor bHLH155 n=1 Tax=Dendrobium catenatum TaxID=906689 RepID=A0A2I0XFX2_9ASPA|nr:transcription factor EMB1444 isoform X2 [Dendrobium catenatum]PKU86805.1 Transcription factor bHLH155 [Dendrobium catenatum]